MGDRFDTNESTKKLVELEKQIDRDVSDWQFNRIRHSTTEESLKIYNKIKGKNLTTDKVTK